MSVRWVGDWMFPVAKRLNAFADERKILLSKARHVRQKQLTIQCFGH